MDQGTGGVRQRTAAAAAQSLAATQKQGAATAEQDAATSPPSKVGDHSSGSNTPYSTSLGSNGSRQSAGSSDRDDGDFFLGDAGSGSGSGSSDPAVVTPPEARAARQPFGKPESSKQQQQQQQQPPRQLTAEDRALFERLEREWIEEDKRMQAQESSWYSAVLWMPLLLVLRAINIGLGFLFWPVSFFARVFLGKRLKYAPFWEVPLERRKQTAVVFYFIMLIPLTAASYLWSIVLLLFPLTTLPMAAYYAWIFVDKSPRSGTRKPFMRYWSLWRHFVNYFPLRLIKTANLDPRGRYVFGYHPHGILSMGAFGSFATDAAGFSRKFPGVDLRLLTLDQNFRCPLMREFLLSMGICSAARSSCDRILQRGPGSAIMLVVGGAAESLDTEPGTFRLTLERQGFVRVALDNGADLVPVLAFGENDVYDTIWYPNGTWQRRIQERIRDKIGFATPVFSGRGIFNYSMGLMPHRKPVIVVVGKPVKLPRLPPHLRGKALFEPEGKQLVSHYHQKYKEALRDLWDLYKERWAVNRQGSLVMQR